MTDAFTVHESIPRIVEIGGAKFRLIAQDFATVDECERAASAAGQICRDRLAPLPPTACPVPVSELDGIASMLGIMACAYINADDSRPFGNCIILEPAP